MKRFMTWMTEKFGPALAKVTDNAYVGSIADGMMLAIPLILVGTFAMIFTTLKPYIPFYQIYPSFRIIRSGYSGYLVPSQLLIGSWRGRIVMNQKLRLG